MHSGAAQCGGPGSNLRLTDSVAGTYGTLLRPTFW